MPKLQSILRSKNFLVTALGASLIVGATAVVAQTTPMEPIQWDKRRLEQLDRNVRRLERALTQRNAAGQPVIVEPDPEVVALQGRVGGMDRRLQDMEESLQRVNGDLERLGFELDEANRANTTLNTRVRDAEAKVRDLEAAAQRESILNSSVSDESPTGDPARDLAAAVRLAASDPQMGDRALQTVTLAWPDTPQAREANSRLGALRLSEGDNQNAAAFYAAALEGWPQTSWAPSTTLDLATALNGLDRKTQACAALNEFNTRYPTAAPAVKTRAAELRTRFACPAAPAARPATPRRGG